MRVLPNSTRQNSDGYISGTDSDFGETSWSDKSSSNGPEEKYQLINKIINLANDTLSLEDIFTQYNIEFQEKYSSTGWTNVCCCPFPDHKDDTPSFGYNAEQDRFYCFGCHKSGRSSHFIAFMEDRPVLQVAKEILVSKRDVSINSFSKKKKLDYAAFSNLLIKYASKVQEFRIAHQDSEVAQHYVDDVTWPLDVYIDTHVVKNTVNLEYLSAMVNMLIEKLELYQI